MFTPLTSSRHNACDRSAAFEGDNGDMVLDSRRICIVKHMPSWCYEHQLELGQHGYRSGRTPGETSKLSHQLLSLNQAESSCERLRICLSRRAAAPSHIPNQGTHARVLVANHSRHLLLLVGPNDHGDAAVRGRTSDKLPVTRDATPGKPPGLSEVGNLNTFATPQEACPRRWTVSLLLDCQWA